MDVVTWHGKDGESFLDINVVHLHLEDGLGAIGASDKISLFIRERPKTSELFSLVNFADTILFLSHLNAIQLVHSMFFGVK